jgi:hypothetical protein
MDEDLYKAAVEIKEAIAEYTKAQTISHELQEEYSKLYNMYRQASAQEQLLGNKVHEAKMRFDQVAGLVPTPPPVPVNPPIRSTGAASSYLSTDSISKALSALQDMAKQSNTGNTY